MKVSIVNKNTENAETICSLIMQHVDESGFDYDEDNPDYVFFVGGDGTLLKAVHQYKNKLNDIVFIGINDATLGFFYDYEKEDIPELFELINSNELPIESYKLLKGNIGGKHIIALNEIRVENPWHTLISNVYLNDKLLETFHGNGLLVCSALGSSGYNKSENGALIEHSLDLLQLTEIATIQNNMYRSVGNSIILPPSTKIRFEGNFHETVVGYDHLSTTIEGLKEIEITLSNTSVFLAQKKDINYYDRIKRSFIK